MSVNVTGKRVSANACLASLDRDAAVLFVLKCALGMDTAETLLTWPGIQILWLEDVGTGSTHCGTRERRACAAATQVIQGQIVPFDNAQEETTS